jgi:hypothetical protein
LTRAAHKKAAAQKADRREFCLARHDTASGVSYHWLNRHNELVPLRAIPAEGIKRIYYLLTDAEDRVPHKWIEALRDHAASRGIELEGKG